MNALRLRLPLVAGPLACALAATPSCSVETARGSNAATLTFALTESFSDQIASFTIDVDEIRLTREDGDVRQVLGTRLRVDLAALTDVALVLDLIDLEPALYDTVTFTLDFTDAACFLAGEQEPAAILDGDGILRTGRVRFPIEIAGSIPAESTKHRLVELDLGVARSTEVHAQANTVTYEPMFAAVANPSSPKELVVVGTLVSADEARLLVDLRAPSGARIDTAYVSIDSETVFQLDGVPVPAAAASAAFAQLGAGAPVHCYGTIDDNRRRYTATYVEAGIGTAGGGTDIVEGHVVGRVGGPGEDATLTVVGQGRRAAGASFDTTFTVVTSLADTRVARRSVRDELDTDDLNVGQRVSVFGTLSGARMDADTSQSVVRILPAHVFGIASGAPSSGILTVELRQVGQEPVERFAWSEGGTTPPDPGAFTLNVEGLTSGLSIGAGTAVEARGIFPGVDDDGADLAAQALFDRSASARVVVRDRAGGITVVPEIDPVVDSAGTTGGILLEISGFPGLGRKGMARLPGGDAGEGDGEREDVIPGQPAAPGEVLRIDRGFLGSESLPILPAPVFSPPQRVADPLTGLLPFTLFSLRDRDQETSRVYTDWEEFAEDLIVELGRGGSIYDLVASGAYDASLNRTTTSVLGVIVD